MGIEDSIKLGDADVAITSDGEVLKDRYGVLDEQTILVVGPDEKQARTIDYALAVRVLAASLLAPRPADLELDSKLAVKLAEVTLDAAETLTASMDVAL